MSRALRLLDLMQLLRRHRYPVQGAKLAKDLNISLRTLYRDIATLQAQGADIEGEAGVGYLLKPGFMLPPLMFSEEELEALVLGSRWVAQRGDDPLADSANNALAKIRSVVPKDLIEYLDATALLVPPGPPLPTGEIDLKDIRQAIREERKILIDYRDPEGRTTHRLLWPFAIGYFDHAHVAVAWCELRNGFRHFRTDRILSLSIQEQRYPRRRQSMLKAWRIQDIALNTPSHTADKN